MYLTELSKFKYNCICIYQCYGVLIHTVMADQLSTVSVYTCCLVEHVADMCTKLQKELNAPNMTQSLKRGEQHWQTPN